RRDAVISTAAPPPPHHLTPRKKDTTLNPRVLVGVRPVDGVLLYGFAVLSACRAAIGLLRIGRSHHLAQMGDGVAAFQRGDVHGAGDHVLHQVAIEGPFAMHGVEALRLFLRETDFLQAQDREAFPLQAVDDLPEISFADRVRLDDGEGAVRHGGADYSGALELRNDQVVLKAIARVAWNGRIVAADDGVLQAHGRGDLHAIRDDARLEDDSTADGAIVPDYAV